MKKFSTMILLLFIAAISVFAQEMQMPACPVDKDVVMGKLDNGLTYYVRKNAYPEHRVSFYIAQKVGSIQEEEDQRGLAHFLEHMAFNGSEHFKGDGIIEYTRSLGVAFGADLNAYTSTDETVYNIDNVPSDRQSALDSCLLILKDWSNGLLLEDAEIDKERGVIHEEWRLRSAATQRMLERNLENIYPGSKYGKRFPIGLMSVIDNFQYDALRNYYKKWYHPGNQAIIVVGDIDVDYTVNKIKEMFSVIPAKENADPVVDEPVPDNEKMIVVVDKDKEQTSPVVLLCMKTEPLPKEMRNTMIYPQIKFMLNLIGSVINERMQEAAQEPDCPFLQASIDYGTYIMSKTMDCVEIDVVPKDGMTEEAIAAAYRIAVRAFKTGLTETELQRAKDNIISQLEKEKDNKDKRHTNIYTRMLVRNFLDNTPMMGIEDEYAIMQQMASMIPAEAINQALPELFKVGEENMVVLSLNPEKEGYVLPEPEKIKSCILAVDEEKFEAYVDNVKDEPLITKLPKPGKIVKEISLPQEFGAKTLVLSNGAKVTIKKTDFKDNEIQYFASSLGGMSLLPKSDVCNMKLVNYAVEMSGLGNFDNQELQKALAGKQVSISFGLGNSREEMNGSTTPKDLETLLQLNYLYFTQIKKDQKSYDNLIAMLESQLKNMEVSPDYAYSDSLRSTLYNHNPAFGVLKAADLKNVDYDRCLQIAKERLANAADFHFYFVGNYDEAQLRELICKYIASLPANKKKLEKNKPFVTYYNGQCDNTFTRKMETPKANSQFYWYNTKVPYTVENQINAQCAGEVFSQILLKRIREDESAAYSTGAQGNVSPSHDVVMNMLVAACPVKPEKKDICFRIIEEEVQKLAETVDAEVLNKVKTNLITEDQNSLKKNGYWINLLNAYTEFGLAYPHTQDVINAVTPESVSKYVRDVILKGGNKVKVVMLPEE